MNNDQDLPSFNEHETAGDEIGSDELLSDDDLRLRPAPTGEREYACAPARATSLARSPSS